MKTKKLTQRMDIGEAVIAAAQLTDTTAVADPLRAFVESHAVFTEAQAAVAAAQGGVDEVADDIGNLATHMHDAVDALVRSLMMDGGERPNPLVAYGNTSSYALSRLVPGDAAPAVRRLVKAVLNDRNLSRTSRAAAESADLAAQAVVDALPALEPLEANLREARRRRDNLGDRWDEALRVLRHGARYAESSGAHGLYDALFGRAGRKPLRKGKRATPAASDPNAAAA
jgi:hypothetical protein